MNCEGSLKYYSTIKPADLDVTSRGLHDINDKTHYSCRNVMNIRNKFAAYFEGDGAISWQLEKALLNDF